MKVWPMQRARHSLEILKLLTGKSESTINKHFRDKQRRLRNDYDVALYIKNIAMDMLLDEHIPHTKE